MNHIRSVLLALFWLIIGMVIIGAISISVMRFAFGKYADWVVALLMMLAMLGGLVIWVAAMTIFEP